MSLFAKIGGDELRAVITEFYRRVFDDVMIGYMFAGKDRARLIEMEWQLVANLLGAEGIRYTGRPMRAAHAQHTIFSGHFDRRLKILEDVLAERGIDADVQRAWIDHSESLRAQITAARPTIAREIDPDKPIKLGRK